MSLHKLLAKPTHMYTKLIRIIISIYNGCVPLILYLYCNLAPDSGTDTYIELTFVWVHALWLQYMCMHVASSEGELVVTSRGQHVATSRRLLLDICK